MQYASENGQFTAGNLPNGYTLQYNPTQLDLVPGRAAQSPGPWR